MAKKAAAVAGVATGPVELKDTQKVLLGPIQGVDDQGNPVALDASSNPTWVSSDESVGTVTPTPDDLSAEVVTTGKVGAFTVTVTGDADLGAGVVPVVGTVDFTVVADQATSIAVPVGTPEPK